MTPQYRQVMIDARTTGQGIADCKNYNNLVAYLYATAALSAGTLIIEESDDAGATDAWSQIASVTLATPFLSAGGWFAYHLPVSGYAFVKCRIGTTVVGGTLTVVLRAN